MVDLVFYGFFLFLLFYKIDSRFVPSKTLEKDQTALLKGFLAIWVVLHHIAIEPVAKNEGSLVFFDQTGTIPTAIFFFLMGYGTFTSYMQNPEYHKEYIKKKMVNVVIPYLLVAGFYKLIGSNYGYGVLWFIRQGIIFYGVFYIAMRLFKNKQKLVLGSIYLTCFAITVYLMMTSVKMWEYETTFAIFLGAVYAYSKHGDRLLLETSAVTFFLSLIMKNEGLSYTFQKFGISVIFILFFAAMLKNYKIGNKILEGAGKISFELYLIHPFFQKVVPQYNLIFYAIIFLIVSVASACIFHSICYNIKSILLKRARG